MLKDEVGLRPMNIYDVDYLLEIDSQVSEFPWDVKEWRAIQQYFKDWVVEVGTIRNRPSSFSVLELVPPKSVARIHKLVATVEAAKHGLDLALLEAAITLSASEKIRKIEVTVPETSCRGADDPYDISEWLKRAGFVCEEIDKNAFEAYGRMFDNYVFRRTILTK